MYQIQSQASSLLKKAYGTRRKAICTIACKYSDNIHNHHIGTKTMGWREYEQLYAKEEREKMYYEQIPRSIYAGY